VSLSRADRARVAREIEATAPMIRPRRRRRSHAVAYALWANAALLSAILVVMLGRDNSLKLTPAAFGQVQPLGGGGLYLMPAQISTNVWGCYVMDIDQQTLCGYAMTGSPPELKLVTARNFRYDRQLGALNTMPPPSEVKAMLEKEKESSRVTGRDAPKNENPEVKPKSE
jgi:hypothetical protein